jgi:hypothetical protein
VSDSTIAKELSKVIKSLGRPQDKLRLLCIYLLCYALPDSDFRTVQSLMNGKEEK